MIAAYQQTLRTQAEYSSPAELIKLLYEQAILQLTLLEHNPANMEAQSKYIAILDTLLSALNPTQGGALAHTLHDLYVWLLASVVRDKKISEAKQCLQPLLEAWREICKP